MTWAVDTNIAGTLGTAGTFAALAMFMAPIGTFQRIMANKSTEEFSSFPYIAMLMNCSVWVFYALPFITPDRTSPLVTNLIGMFIEIAYIVIFGTFAKDKHKQSFLQYLYGYLSVMAFLLVCIFGVVKPEHRSTVLGIFAVVFTVIMFGSPLASLAVVIRTRSVEFMPLSLSLMGFVCSATWTLYGIYVQDVFVVIPNVLGMLLGVAQLLIYFAISRLSRRASASKPSQEEEIGLVEGTKKDSST